MRAILIKTAILFIYCATATAQLSPADSVGQRQALNIADPIPARTVEGKKIDTLKAKEIRPADTLVTSAPEGRRPEKKSVRKAFFLSLAVPGAGEYYVGHKKYTRGFLASEAAIWAFALFSNYQGGVWRDDYIAYAAAQAGANPRRRDDRYYENIYEWPNSDWYNEYQWVEARDLYPDDPAAQAAYVADKLYAAVDAWEWKSRDEWNRFRNLRVKSESAYRRVTFAVGAALLNHTLSAVNAARLAKSHNSKTPLRRRMAMEFNVHPAPGGSMAVSVTGRF